MSRNAFRIPSLAFAAAVALTGCGVNNYSFHSDPIQSGQVEENPTSDRVRVTLKKYKPALAVRGAQCMICHASLQANVVTDFGHGGPNFLANPARRARIFLDNPQIGATTHHTNESAYTNQRDAWQSANAIAGQVIVPNFSFSDDQLELMTGVRTSMTLKQLMEHPNLTGTGPMTSKITVPAGETEKVLEANEVVISAPTESEILSLLSPSGLASSLAVEAYTRSGSVPSVAEHFVRDAGRAVIRNDFTTRALTCKGDVVVRGTLLLKNAVITTDRSGCRIYVTEGIHIQGTLSLDAPTGETPNLQLTSAKAVLIGFDADSMGASGPGGARAEIYSPITSRLARFGKRLDIQYNPSGAAIAGVPSADYFGGLTAEAARLGDYLKDAVESATANEVPAGASIVNGRLAVNYRHILLNAPQVHSRYFGDLEGVVVADVAFLARNPLGQNLERFVYDSVFDSAPLILPALGREILRVK